MFFALVPNSEPVEDLAPFAAMGLGWGLQLKSVINSRKHRVIASWTYRLLEQFSRLKRVAFRCESILWSASTYGRSQRGRNRHFQVRHVKKNNDKSPHSMGFTSLLERQTCPVDNSSCFKLGATICSGKCRLGFLENALQ